jgi:hypothetical protein
MRKDPPTLIASRSPACRRRYTVCFDTRKIAATSKTVRNLVVVREGLLPVTAPPWDLG